MVGEVVDAVQRSAAMLTAFLPALSVLHAPKYFETVLIASFVLGVFCSSLATTVVAGFGTDFQDILSQSELIHMIIKQCSQLNKV